MPGNFPAWGVDVFQVPYSIYQMIYCDISIPTRLLLCASRLENEHLNNVGKYRAFKSVPLPFSYYEEDEDKDD